MERNLSLVELKEIQVFLNHYVFLYKKNIDRILIKIISDRGKI